MTCFTNLNGTLIFRNLDSHEIWRSDGTDAGTTLVKNIGFDGNPEDFVSINGNLYFRGDDGIHGQELMKTDGTTSGTLLVKDIQPGIIGSDIMGITNANGTLFFAADNGIIGEELWQSDKTDMGTQPVSDINPGANHSYPSQFINVNGNLLFTADDGVHGSELWALKLGVGFKQLSGSNFQLYPNPAKEYISIQLDHPVSSGIEILNTDGTIVQSVSTPGLNPKIHIENLPSGLYFIKVTNTEGTGIQKFIKQ